MRKIALEVRAMTTEQMKVGIVGAGNDEGMVKEMIRKIENTEQMNREVWLWLDKTNCWHEWVQGSYEKWCGKCDQAHSREHENPDFSCGAGIIRLLKEMMKRNNWGKFKWSVGGRDMYQVEDNIRISYITEDGKLLEAVWSWSKEHPR